MRVSTSWMYSNGSAVISRKQAEMVRTQQQLGTDRRVLTPSDDPIAASSALTTEQARALTEQYQRNQGFAQGTLRLAESTLAQVGEALQSVRSLVVSAGNGSLGAKDRASLAVELRGTIDTLLTLANAGDGAGSYLFSGFQEGVQPFTRSAAGVAYQGDQGTRALQVSSQRTLEISASGSDVFEGSRAGNGSFTVNPAGTNTGSGMADAGRVINPAGLTGDSYRIVFGAGGTTYDIVDTTTAATLVTGAAYVPGSAISVDGMQVTLTGTPTAGDSFDLAPAGRQSMFKTLEDLAALLEGSAQGTVTEAAYQTLRVQGLAAIDGAHDHALSVRTSIGSRMNELDSLGSLSADQVLAHQQEYSRLMDLDYAEAISRLAQQQASLEAAQKSYLGVTSLSLFKLI